MVALTGKHICSVKSEEKGGMKGGGEIGKKRKGKGAGKRPTTQKRKRENRETRDREGANQVIF